MNPRRKLSVRLRALSAVSVWLVCLAGCSAATGKGAGTPAAKSDSISVHQYGSGPLRLVVRVAPLKTDTAGKVVLAVETETASGWTATQPVVGARLGGFTVSRRSTGPTDEVVSGGYTRNVSTYWLEPFLPGAYVVPTLTAQAVNGTRNISVASDTVPVTVTSLIPAGTKGPLKLKGLASPLTIPSAFAEIFAGAVALLAVMAAGFFLLFGRLRTKRRALEAPDPPWVRATKELDRLVARNLPNTGRHREFYDGISLLVRRYIEEMFDLNAPDQTTEEFLYSVRESPELGRHRRFLSEFLGHCDMVKFAAYVPAQDEIHRAVRSCRIFIESSSRDYSGRMESEST